MTVRILCPGPSLAAYDPGDFAGPVIAVNRAGLRYPATIWGATDYPTIKYHREHVVGTPNLLTRRQTAHDLRGRLDRFPSVVLVEDLKEVPAGRSWSLKTMTCAMVFALNLGASRVELFGCDWAGQNDFDGVAAGEDRSEGRWDRERRDYEAVATWMRGRGCDVTRNAVEGG